MANDQERRFAATTSFGLTAATTIVQNQISLLRLWADNIERFAQVYEDGTDALRRAEQDARRDRAI